MRMLTLLEPSADVRERFLSGQTKDHESPRDLIARWERVRARGLLPDRTDAAGVDALQLTERRERLANILRGHASLFEPLVRDLESRALVAVVADHEGVVLYRHGREVIEQAAVLDQLAEGSRWSEDVRGTNAVGTSLVERRPIGVLGGAHFDRASSGIFCYASPVFDPHGELICTLDVSGPMSRHEAAFGTAICAASSAVELMLRTQLFDAAVVGGLPTLARVIEHLREPAFVIDVRGQILCGNACASDVLDDLGPIHNGRLCFPPAVARAQRPYLARGAAVGGARHGLYAEQLCQRLHRRARLAWQRARAKKRALAGERVRM